MVIKKEAMERIRKIIEKHHKYLLITMVGQGNVPRELAEELKRQGLEPKSFLEQAYHHNWLNQMGPDAPKSVHEMKAQQLPHVLPKGDAHAASVEYLNSNLTHLIDKQRAEVLSRIEGMIHNENNEFKFGALKDLNREEAVGFTLKQHTKSQLKTKLKDIAKDATRNWERIVNTELSNAISLGSADRIVAMNRDTPPEEVYVYRIVVKDAALCKYCRRFYLEGDGTPKLYRLATILANGSNYGKKAAEWKPSAMATHPNERCSQLLELKPGWKVLPNGSQTFIGLEKWKDYLRTKKPE
jgi:hypothetical protein